VPANKQNERAREQNERARLSFETDMVFKLEDRFKKGLLPNRINAAQYIRNKYGDRLDGLDSANIISDNRAVWDVLNFFEYLAHLTKSEALSSVAVWEKFGYWIEGYWALYKPEIERHRHTQREPNYYGDFGALNDKMIEIDRLEEGIEGEFTTQSKLRAFVEAEATLR
jgi:hypothetical protein